MSLLTPQPTFFSLLTPSSLSLSKTPSFFFLPKPTFSPLKSHTQTHHPYDPQQQDEDDEEHVIGDCLVFEEGVFEDPYVLNQDSKDFTNVNHNNNNNSKNNNNNNNNKNKNKVEVKQEDLVPSNWKDVQAEINITKKERRKMAQEMEFGSRLQRRKQGLMPIPMGYASAKEYKAAKLRELKPLVLDNPKLLVESDEEEGGSDEGQGVGVMDMDRDRDRDRDRESRVVPKNPKMAVYGRGLDDISQFLNSGLYDPEAAKDPDGHRKLFTKDEKFLMNRRVPDLAAATSGKWQPLHTIAASGEFYLVDTLMRYNADINIPNEEGLTAIHKAILGKKHAICNYLLRNSANPFVRDKDGATLMHYAVRTASTQMIKVLLLYNVDINLQDNDGWTPLHLAVQARRTDVVRLLLIKKADKTIKNQGGLTPLDLCLYSGRDTRTYEMIRLLKVPPKPRKHAQLME